MILTIYLSIVLTLFFIFIGSLIISYKKGLVHKEGYANVEDFIEKYIWQSIMYSVAWPIYLIVIIFHGLNKTFVWLIKKAIRNKCR